MSYESLKDILANVKKHGWSAENVSFGSGGEVVRGSSGRVELGDEGEGGKVEVSGRVEEELVERTYCFSVQLHSYS